MKSNLFFIFLITTLVSPKSFSGPLEDSIIEAKLWAAYTINENINPFDIDIRVDEGNIALHGVVPDRATKALAAELATGVEGVKKVENFIALEANERDSSKFKDLKITTIVESKLIWNRHVSGMDIDVDTTKGEVVLRGKVPSDNASKIAESLAMQTRGVRKVENRLKIETENPSKLERRLDELSRAVNDAWIEKKIEAQFLSTSAISARKIEVTVTDKNVTLKGRVESSTERDLAIQIAENTVGTEEVLAEHLTVDKNS